MPTWDPKTRQTRASNEFVKEFEKYILEKAYQLHTIAQTSSALAEKGKQIEESLEGATDSVEELTDAAKNLSDDKEEEITEEEHKEAKASLLTELQSIADAAIDLGNIKLAYRIERTISEISGE
jgi:seryl-tRNA synthetase